MDILVVDDDRASLESARHVLCAAGYNVLTATDGQQAIEILRTTRCRIVVTDWAMPRMNGTVLCRTIRDSDLHGYTYVILLTGKASQHEVLEGLECGADDYITKPFQPAELVMRVNIGRRIIGMETRDMTIFAMAKLAESRDPETGAHIDRVRTYCRGLARQLQRNGVYPDEVNDDFVRLIYETSPLHDIGKIAIPDCILLKPGQLTESEFELMKLHTVEGAKTLQAALDLYPQAKFLQMARDIALTHHEKFDGSGYPRGLAGQSIPLCGRIVAVADVYDALTSKRVYKDALSHEVAKSLIQEESGSRFDPAIVQCFLDLESEFQGIRRAKQDDLYQQAPSGPRRPMVHLDADEWLKREVSADRCLQERMVYLQAIADRNPWSASKNGHPVNTAGDA